MQYELKFNDNTLTIRAEFEPSTFSSTMTQIKRSNQKSHVLAQQLNASAFVQRFVLCCKSLSHVSCF